MSERESVLDDPNGYVSRKSISGINEITGNRARYHWVVSYQRRILFLPAGTRTVTYHDDKFLQIITGYTGIEHIDEGHVVQRKFNPLTGKFESFVHDHMGSHVAGPNLPCRKQPVL